MTSYEIVKEQYARLTERLNKLDPETKEYNDVLKEWILVHERVMAEDKAETEVAFRNYEMSKPIWKRPEFIITLVQGVITFGGMGMMLNYEKIGNITSKAVGWIPKPRFK